MIKFAVFLIFAIIPWCVIVRSSEGSVCLLEDPKNQCGSFCMSVLKPLLDHIAKHQDQWSISDALRLNETQVKLDRIEGLQAALDKTIRTTMPQDIEAKLNTMTSQQEYLVSNGKESLNKLERIISQDLGAKLVKMESQQILWQQKLIEKIDESQKIFEQQKREVESQLKNLRDELSSLQNSTKYKKIPSNFQKIGNRFFYIDRTKYVNWFAASDSCRRMGGQLAIIENEEERIAVAAENKDGVLWLDIHNLANKADYTSSATGTKVPFLKWGKNQPNVIKEDCVALADGDMHDYDCYGNLFYICQA